MLPCAARSRFSASVIYVAAVLTEHVSKTMGAFRHVLEICVPILPITKVVDPVSPRQSNRMPTSARRLATYSVDCRVPAKGMISWVIWKPG